MNAREKFKPNRFHKDLPPKSNLPHHLVDAFQTVRKLIDTYLPILEQAVLVDFIVECHLDGLGFHCL